MSFFSDFKAINKVVIKKTFETLTRNLVLIPLLLFYVLVYRTVGTILFLTIGSLGTGGQFIASLMEWMLICFMMSEYLSHLDDAIHNRKIKLRSVGSHYMTYFMPLLSATAIPNIILYLFQRFAGLGIHPMILYLFYIVYAIPEVVYQKEIDRLDIFVYGHRFIKENWKQWLISNTFFTLIIFVGFYNKLYSMIFPLAPIAQSMWGLDRILDFNISVMINWLILALPLIIMFVYRGYLFKILSVSSRRKREYMRNIYGK